MNIRERSKTLFVGVDVHKDTHTPQLASRHSGKRYLK